MTLADVMERADDATLQQREEAFSRIRVRVAPHEFAASVHHGLTLHAFDVCRVPSTPIAHQTTCH
jgi:hypothetical protein